jgi:hypothetical protein
MKVPFTLGTVGNGASMKPTLSRRAVKIVFGLFFVPFYRHLTTTHLLALVLDHAAAFTPQ